jgi:hypothetical protein
MLKLIAMVALLLGFTFQVSACDEPEAHIISTIVSMEKGEAGCFARLQPETTPYFSPSSICPLFLEEVMNEPVFISEWNDNGVECRLNVGDDLTGYVYRNRRGIIMYEWFPF